MAWEERNGRTYYNQSVREAGEVRKKYIGAGAIAETIAHADEAIRRAREQRREEGRAELERMRDLVAPALELDEAVDALVWAHLAAGGFHLHRGEWRRGRNA